MNDRFTPSINDLSGALTTVDNLIVLAALLHVRIDDILITDDAVA